MIAAGQPAQNGEIRMETRRLGRSGLEVQTLCLGTMTFGLQVEEAESHGILDYAFDRQLRFLDTADAYPLGGSLETTGATEAIIGRWMHARQNRDKIILATKCWAPTSRGPNSFGLSRQHIISSVEASLKRLQTDYLDLYQAHAFDPEVPIEETLRAFDDLVTAGKVRYIGCSNYPTWRLGQALAAAQQLGISGYASVQPRYNILYRDIEPELLPLCRDAGLGVLVYNPLAGGMLSGKYQVGDEPREKTRFTLGNAAGRYQQRYWDGLQIQAVAELRQLTDARELSLVSVAVAWVLQQPGITSAIIGASRAQQLDASIDALNVVFDQELTDACEAVWWQLPRRPTLEGYR
jgi:aryl-alcohol dehydrogenase-like predicted oxidoreductase